MTTLTYLTGFGNEHETEALAGALPRGQFSPQHPPLGLYPEQLSSSAFTVPRADNRRVWLYRIRPSVLRGGYEPCESPGWRSAPDVDALLTPEPLRWRADFEEQARRHAKSGSRFDQGITTYVCTGDIETRSGGALHTYFCDTPMEQVYLCDADGELLLIPQQGALRLRTECGVLEVLVGEIGVVPAGMCFALDPIDPVDSPESHGASSCGYVCENYGAPFALAERGPAGANGYANNRDFQYPVAAYEDIDRPCELVTRFGGNSFRTRLDHSPLDVVAWTGNSAPYKYDLARFNAMGSVTFDHPDPSIFTVLTSPGVSAGTANLDFVIFPPRWSVADGTFRPPWFHRNVMSECMGLIRGQYGGKAEGFQPGGVSLHNAFTPHGPDAKVYAGATQATLVPEHTGDGLAFMLESRLPFRVTQRAYSAVNRQLDYADCWQGLERKFANRLRNRTGD